MKILPGHLQQKAAEERKIRLSQPDLTTEEAKQGFDRVNNNSGTVKFIAGYHTANRNDRWYALDKQGQCGTTDKNSAYLFTDHQFAEEAADRLAMQATGFAYAFTQALNY